jgi:hypothetical protein
MSDGEPLGLRRREVLAAIGAVAGGASAAGCSAFDRDPDGETRQLGEERARDLAERFAPELYFDEHEQWFPTDPRPYVAERDGEPVVDGFAAFEGYTRGTDGGGGPPAPTVFYHGVEYVDSPLAVVQFWYYFAFDQFTTNFHWHDWEVLHVFVDTESAEPQLYVASSHSARVPNNEFLDPDPGRPPRILSELGSHSSALSVNDVEDQFRRLPAGGTVADITNSAIEGLEDVADIPIAYGLPRDEGSRLPYLIPELDGAPLYDHERLPSIERTDLVADELTVRSFADLASPPAELPERSTGLRFGHGGRGTDADVEYELVPTREIDHITEFDGPRLSFEFAVPAFAEDAVAGHITTTGTPWDQPRFDDPAADITEPNHRAALSDRYEAISSPSSVNSVVAAVTEAITTDDAPEDEGLTTREFPVEAVALLESEPEAVPTFGGLAVVRDVPEGSHRLTVNGPGVEPHSESVAVEPSDEGLTTAGVDGEVPLVARENALKLEVDDSASDAALTDLAVEDDFAGRVYDAPLSGPEAVYLHRGGAYTTEVRDADGAIGAYRVNPDAEDAARIAEPQTGKASLAGYLAAVADETSAAVEAIADGDDPDGGADDGGAGAPVQELGRALTAIAEAARRAADRADAGAQARADESLATLRDRLARVTARLDEARGDLPDELANAIDRRIAQLNRRSDQALAASKP